MGDQQIPDLRRAVHIEALVGELEQHCPLQLLLELDPDHRRTIDLWKLLVELPAGKRAKAYSRLPVDLEPLFKLYDQHAQPHGKPARWVYDYYYFELLAHEQRIRPAFWVKPEKWPLIRRTYQTMFRPQRQAGDDQPESRWRQLWGDLLKHHHVQWRSPSAWLQMLSFDEELPAEYRSLPDSLGFRMVPVYVGVTADELRRCMAQDMADTVLLTPESPGDLVRRWGRFAARLGLPQRWPSRKAQLLEQREEAVIAWVHEELTSAEIARKLVAAGLYPIREQAHDPCYEEEDQFRNAERTTYRLINELTEKGRIRARDVKRRPRGRPRKRK